MRYRTIRAREATEIKYAEVRERMPLESPRVAGGGLIEGEDTDRLEAASRGKERHPAFEAKREAWGLEEMTWKRKSKVGLTRGLLNKMVLRIRKRRDGSR